MAKYKSISLVVLRIVIGWHFLYEGLTKLFAPAWSAAGFLKGSYGFLSGFFHVLAANPTAMGIVNFLNVWGLILIGTALFLGVFVRIAAVSGSVLLLLYYFAYPPFNVPLFLNNPEGHYWIINRNLIEAIALCIVYFYPAMDYSLLNIFKRYRSRVSQKTIKEPVSEPMSEKDGLKRRELLKGLVTLPFYGGVMYAAAKSEALNMPDASTGATLVFKTFDLKDLKGVMPKGKIGKMEMSRLIMGCNLIGGWSHSRDLHYVGSLFRNYNTEHKIFETFDLAEKVGINTTNLVVNFYPFFNRYKKMTGSKMKSISQAFIFPEKPDKFEELKKIIDQGATSLYIQGACSDKMVKTGRIDLLHEALDFVRSQGMMMGIGSHSIQVPIACEKAGLRPDYYFKTMHHDRYWSAHPRENRIEWSVDTVSSPDHNMQHDNIFDLFPEQTIDVFSKIDIPLVGFKVLAGGAIMPKDGIRYAFENGADFVCLGMFDFQLVEDANLVTEILGGNINRQRKWYS
jgi:uncharacterized membrane protein YphA (DoxX/SURF4 family)